MYKDKYLYIYKSINLYIYIYIYLSIDLAIYLSIYILYICFYVFMSIYLSIYVSIYLYVYISICLCIYISICLYVFEGVGPPMPSRSWRIQNLSVRNAAPETFNKSVMKKSKWPRYQVVATTHCDIVVLVLLGCLVYHTGNWTNHSMATSWEWDTYDRNITNFIWDLGLSSSGGPQVERQVVFTLLTKRW